MPLKQIPHLTLIKNTESSYTDDKKSSLKFGEESTEDLEEELYDDLSEPFQRVERKPCLPPIAGFHKLLFLQDVPALKVPYENEEEQGETGESSGENQSLHLLIKATVMCGEVKLPSGELSIFLAAWDSAAPSQYRLWVFTTEHMQVFLEHGMHFKSHGEVWRVTPRSVLHLKPQLLAAYQKHHSEKKLKQSSEDLSLAALRELFSPKRSF
jgi:hypothetical protein